MINSWPPIMYIKSTDLKRCLGDPEMDTRTVYYRLESLGYDRSIKYILTEELIERVSKLQRKKAMLIFDRYSPKSEFAKSLRDE